MHKHYSSLNQFIRAHARKRFTGYLWWDASSSPTIYENKYINWREIARKKKGNFGELEGHLYAPKEQLSVHFEHINGEDHIHVFDLSAFSNRSALKLAEGHYKLGECENFPGMESIKESSLSFQKLYTLNTSTQPSDFIKKDDDSWMQVAQLFVGFQPQRA